MAGKSGDCRIRPLYLLSELLYPWYGDNRYKRYKLTEVYGLGRANEP